MRYQGQRIAALSLLAAIAVVAGLAVATKDLVLERWLAWRLESTDLAVRESAGRRLAARGSLRALDFVLGAMLEKDFDEWFPRLLLDEEDMALGLEEDLSWIREYWKRVGERAVPRLLRAWDAGGEERRCWIALTFRSIGNPGRLAVAGLIDRLGASDSPVRIDAAGALGWLGDGGLTCPECVEALTAALDDQDSEVRESAASALGCYGAQAARSFEALSQCMDDADMSITALHAIAKVAPREAKPLIVERALRHPMWAVRLAAAEAVRELGYGQDAVGPAVGVLERLLADTDPHRRLFATFALRRFGPAARGATPALERVAQSDAEATVREAAAAALTAIQAGRAQTR